MANKSVSKNSIANLVSRIWSMISVFLFIPMYISILGEEAYGLVSFFATIQFVMNLLGLGLSSTLRREFATGNNDDKNKVYKYKLLRSVELIYSLIAISIIMVCFLVQILFQKNGSTYLH